ncbi:hypothetical protein FKP32DRAFT_1563883 [Trametes sanguinea]|nr:hypothetical protein FKP32DRAFT_1563883 [Trametes sanguinea]
MLLSRRWSTFWCSTLVFQLASASPSQSFFPYAVPLSVRSPYLNAWAGGSVGFGSDFANLSNSLPLCLTFVQEALQLGWAGKVRIDNQTYAWMGQDDSPRMPANITNVQVTSTRSIFNMQAGPMNITVTFLSPIEPSDWVLQSLPFSYVSFEATALDGRPHDVQVYSDISAEWLSGDRSSPIQWSQSVTNGSIYHKIELQAPQPFVEIERQAQDGVAYYAMAKTEGLTWQIAQDDTCRNQFRDIGTLANTLTTSFGPIEFVSTVFAIAVDLGNIQSTAYPQTWSIGYVRNPTIQYTNPNGSTQRLSPYFVTQYGNNIDKAIDAVTASYADVLQRAIAFDEAIVGNASKISSHYADLVSLVLRQTMGALEFTVSTTSDGTANASDGRIFMKDDNSDCSYHVHSRIDPVEKMYAALPALLYVNASIMGLLLSPLLDAQDSITDMPYAARDLGVAYPNATGINGPHPEGIEQSGNMLIMLYAHVRFSGDVSLINAHYKLAQRWADYLVANSLTPNNQMTADGEHNANMTNLAIKGIIGVKAMAEISRAVGEHADAQQYDSHAAALVESWQSLAASTDHKHLLGIYGDQQSWTLMYNVYADRLLGTNIVSQALLQGESTFYQSLLQSCKMGAHSDPVCEADVPWQVFTAAIVQDDTVRDGFIDEAWAMANHSAYFPFAATYYVAHLASSNVTRQYLPRPAAGAMYALLALNLQPHPIMSVSNVDGRPGKSVGAIVGAVVGGLGGLTLVALCIFWSLRRRRRHIRLGEEEKPASARKTQEPTLSPYTYTSPNLLPSSQDTEVTIHEDTSPENVETSSSLEAHATRDSVLSVDLRKRPESSIVAEPQPPSAPTRLDSDAAVDSTTVSAPEPQISSDPPSLATPGSRGLPTEVLGLRTQVEILWRTVQEMRAERSDPPPEYSG